MTIQHHHRSARRGARPCLRRILLGALAALLVSAADAPEASAQACGLRVQPRPDDTGYRRRDSRCEGMYIGLQSGSRSVQVISLVRGGLRYELGPRGDSLLFVHVPDLPGEFGARPVVSVLGTARETNLNWALDAVVGEGRVMEWDLRDAIRPQGLASQRVGIAGEVVREGGGGRTTVFVPLAVRRGPGAPAGADSTELVVRVPVAAAVRWSTESTGAMHDAERINVDGFFRILLPAAAARGEQPIAISWRVRGENRWGAPEQLRIYRW